MIKRKALDYFCLTAPAAVPPGGRLRQMLPVPSNRKSRHRILLWYLPFPRPAFTPARRLPLHFKIFPNHFPCRIHAEMSFNVLLCLLAKLCKPFLITVKLHYRPGEIFRFILHQQHVFDTRNPFASHRSGYYRRSVINGLDYLSFDACSISERNDDNPAAPVKLRQFLLGNKPFDDNFASRLLQSFDFIVTLEPTT